VAADSLRLTRRIVAQPALARFQPQEFKPGLAYQSDEELARLTGFDDAEMQRLIEGGGVFDVGEVAPPELKDGDRAPFRQATFTLHDEQWEEVEAAMKKAKGEGGGESSVNENSNGNALAFICERFNRGQG
jgi:hypothetical protein